MKSTLPKVECPICHRLFAVGEGLTHHIAMKHKKLTQKRMELAKEQGAAREGSGRFKRLRQGEDT